MRKLTFDKLKKRVMIAELKEGDLREWRESFGLTQDQAAELLDLANITYIYYETGYRGYGKRVSVPYTVALACRYYSMKMRKKHD